MFKLLEAGVERGGVASTRCQKSTPRLSGTRWLGRGSLDAEKDKTAMDEIVVCGMRFTDGMGV